MTQVWERVRTPLRNALRTLGIPSVPTAKRGELAALENIINREVPELRWAGCSRRPPPPPSSSSHAALLCCRAAATKAGILLGTAENDASAAALSAAAAAKLP